MSTQQRKILSFSLWGKHEFYNYGAVENALIAQTLFPGWTCRFYVNNIDQEVQEILSKMSNVELKQVSQATDTFSNMFWRFEPAFFESNTIVLSRDTDSRLNMREKLAIDDWLTSSLDFSIMRDHPQHTTEILGGLWGAKNNILLPLQMRFLEYSRQNKHGLDQEFLRDIVYPHVRSTAMIHDPFRLYPREAAVSFPQQTDYTSFVGAYCRKAGNTFALISKANRNLELPERMSKMPLAWFYE